MDIATILVAAAVAVVAAATLGCVVTARMRFHAGADRDAAVTAAVDTVLRLAADKLGHQADASSRELHLRQQVFEQRVAAVGEELAAVSALMEDLRRDSARQHGTVVERLEAVTHSSTALAHTTQHLREALASPKQRGQWGERMADDVLRTAGFVEGVSYRRQRALDSGSIPDFTFLLPGDLELRMDVKFPLDNYLKVLEAEADADVARCTKAFMRDVRNRIRELAGRDYVDARDTVDVVLLFVPNEAVYAFLHDTEPGLLDEAMAQKVVLCSPATLFAVLAVIRQAVDHFHLERTSDQILRCLGGVTNEWTRFTEALDTVEKRLQTLTNGIEELQGPRRRKLQSELDAVERLRTAALEETDAAATSATADDAGALRALPGGAAARGGDARQAG